MLHGSTCLLSKSLLSALMSNHKLRQTCPAATCDLRTWSFVLSCFCRLKSFLTYKNRKRIDTKCEDKSCLFPHLLSVIVCVSHVKLPLQMCCVLSPKRTGSVSAAIWTLHELDLHFLSLRELKPAHSALFPPCLTVNRLLWCPIPAIRPLFCETETLPLMLLEKKKKSISKGRNHVKGRSLKVDLTSFGSNGFVWMLMQSVAFLTHPANKQRNTEQHAAALLCRGSVFWTWNLKLLWLTRVSALPSVSPTFTDDAPLSCTSSFGWSHWGKFNLQDLMLNLYLCEDEGKQEKQQGSKCLCGLTIRLS